MAFVSHCERKTKRRSGSMGKDLSKFHRVKQKRRSAALCHRNSTHLTFTRRRVFNTRLRVDLTRGCVSFTRRCGKPSSCRSTAIDLLRSWFSGSFAGLWHCATILMSPLLVFGLFYLLFSLFCISVPLWLCYLPSTVPFWFYAVLPL